MDISRSALVGLLVFAWGIDARARDRNAQKTFRCAWEAPAVEVFAISEDGSMLEIPDVVYYRVKRESFVMEIVQGEEKQRFEPLTTYAIQLKLKTPDGRLQALKHAYDVAFGQARRPRDRGDGTSVKAPDGFSVDVRYPETSGILEATVVLYDCDDSYRERLLKSVAGLAAMVQARYEALAKYMGDLSAVTGEYVKALSAIQQDVAEFDGYVGELRIVEKALARMSTSLEHMVARLQSGTDEEIAQLNQRLAAYTNDIGSQLKSIRSQLASIETD